MVQQQLQPSGNQPRKRKFPLKVVIVSFISIVVGIALAMFTSQTLHGESRPTPAGYDYQFQRSSGIPFTIYTYYHYKNSSTRSACLEVDRKNGVCGAGGSINGGIGCAMSQGSCFDDNPRPINLLLNAIFWSILVFGVLFFVTRFFTGRRGKQSAKPEVSQPGPTGTDKPIGG